jgi:hypothetical protein
VAEFTQLPGTLDITTVAGDDVLIPIVLTGLNLTGYTLTATVFGVIVSPGSRTGAYAIDPDVGIESLTVTVTNAATGALSLSFEGLDAMQNKRWSLTMTSGGVTRCVVSGSFTVVLP